MFIIGLALTGLAFTVNIKQYVDHGNPLSLVFAVITGIGLLSYLV